MIERHHAPTETLTIVDLLRRRAVEQPDDVAYTLLRHGEADDPVRLTFAEVDRRARAIAVWLQSRGAAGQRVVLLYEPSLDFTTAFFGCLYAGAVPVAAYPLDPERLERTQARLAAIVADATPAVGLTTPASAALLNDAPGGERAGSVTWQATDAIPEALAAEYADRSPALDALAFLQYTSGSISAPKGVMVTHRSLLADLKIIQESFGHSARTTFVAWLPLAHDWGLVNCVVQPVFLGARSVIMPVEAFLAQPARWLRAISRYDHVTSGGPNFAYDLCVRKISTDERRTLDLRSWVHAGIAAEPVRPSTIDAFADAFGPCGFDRRAFYAAYGLAETTVFVCCSRRTAEPRVLHLDKARLARNSIAAIDGTASDSVAVPTSGPPHPDERVAIVDPESRRICPPDRVGEIWIAGPHVAAGYWNNPAETERTLRASLAETGEGVYLRTGDLGFLHDGELVVTGRLKDLIIVRGRNIYPQDLERSAASCHPGVRPGGTVAFSIDDAANESLVLVQELRDPRSANRQEIVDAIRRVVLADHDLTMHRVVLTAPGAVPKTSSGKLQRSACRQAYLAGALAVVEESVLADSERARTDAPVAPRTATERTLAELWSSVLNAEAIGVLDRVVDFSDSIMATQFLHRVRETFGVTVSMASLFRETTTLAELAERIERTTVAASATPTP